eukprot:3623840-Karenia_brevis.AAC.1
MRKGGYSCSQWVLGKLPRRADDSRVDTDHVADLGIISEQVGFESAFQRTMQIRTACRRAFSKEDWSTR